MMQAVAYTDKLETLCPFKAVAHDNHTFKTRQGYKVIGEKETETERANTSITAVPHYLRRRWTGLAPDWLNRECLAQSANEAKLFPFTCPSSAVHNLPIDKQNLRAEGIWPQKPGIPPKTGVPCLLVLFLPFSCFLYPCSSCHGPPSSFSLSSKQACHCPLPALFSQQAFPLLQHPLSLSIFPVSFTRFSVNLSFQQKE